MYYTKFNNYSSCPYCSYNPPGYLEAIKSLPVKYKSLPLLDRIYLDNLNWTEEEKDFFRIDYQRIAIGAERKCTERNKQIIETMVSLYYPEAQFDYMMNYFRHDLSKTIFRY